VLANPTVIVRAGTRRVDNSSFVEVDLHLIGLVLAAFNRRSDRLTAPDEVDDGYQRQSVIRFAAGLYPRLAYRTVGADRTDEALPGKWTLDEITTHRERLRNLYLDALRDDDGRVRRAGAKAIKELALTAEMLGKSDELRSMMDELKALAAECADLKRKHIEQAYENVAFHAEKPFSLLPDGLRDVLEGDEHSSGR